MTSKAIEPREPSPDSRDSGEPERLTYLIKKLELALRSEVERALRPLDVTGPQHNVMVSLRLRPKMSSAELARHNHVSAQAANVLVATLERKGLVARRPDEDNQRILRMELTPWGATVLAECEELVEEISSRMLVAVSEENRRALHDSLQSCVAALAGLPDGDGSR